MLQCSSFVLSTAIGNIVNRWKRLRPVVDYITEKNAEISNRYRDTFLVSPDVWSPYSRGPEEVAALQLPYLDGLRALSTIKGLGWDDAMVSTKHTEFLNRWRAVISYPIQVIPLNSPEQKASARNLFFLVFVKHGAHSVPLEGDQLVTHDVLLVAHAASLPDRMDLDATSGLIQQSLLRYNRILPFMTAPDEAELHRTLKFVKMFLGLEQTVDVTKIAPELVQFHDAAVFLSSLSGRSKDEVAKGT